MQLTVLGLNHRTAPVEIRERFNFSNDRVASILRRFENFVNTLCGISRRQKE